MSEPNTSTTSAYAPGRVELLGNHTDYNDGYVLAGAINRGVTIDGRIRKDGIIALHSLTLARQLQIPLSTIERQRGEPWANYVLGVVRELLAAGVAIGGFDAEISSTLPLGGGLASSAALEVATARFLLKLHSLTLDPLELAKLCRRAENGFVGVQSGLLDQATSIFGRENQLVYLDCRLNQVQTLPFPSGYALIIADSGVKHSLVEGEYNLRRQQCQAAAHALGRPALRDVTLPQIESATLDPLLRKRAFHIVAENERVLRAVELLERGDGAAFGRLMDESHESSRLNFENSTPELDLMVNIAREFPGVIGSRLSGGGFGGCTVTLAESRVAETVAAQLARDYSHQSGLTPHVFVCRLSDGAR